MSFVYYTSIPGHPFIFMTQVIQYI